VPEPAKLSSTRSPGFVASWGASGTE
jgi:hypothetical protein